MTPARQAHMRPTPTGWAVAISEWRLHLAAADRTPQTIQTRTEHIERIARAFPAGPAALTARRWEQWSGRQQWATETRRSYTASVRTFYRWLNGTDPTETAGRIAPAVPVPRPIPDGPLRAALAAADTRTTLILRLAAEAGLRRAEIAALHRDQLQDFTLHIIGKGRRPRVVPISPSLAGAIARNCDPAGWLFPGPKGHLTPRHVSVLAGRVLPAPWTLHSLRHRFAAAAYTGKDLLAVQRLLGHVSPATTQRYVPTPLDQLQAAAAYATIYR